MPIVGLRSDATCVCVGWLPLSLDPPISESGTKLAGISTRRHGKRPPPISSTSVQLRRRRTSGSRAATVNPAANGLCEGKRTLTKWQPSKFSVRAPIRQILASKLTVAVLRLPVMNTPMATINPTDAP